MEEITPIYSIQGAGHTSTFVSRTVTTEGVVTAIDSNGFYIQAEAGDGNASTSDAIFVFTGTAPGVTLGHLVQVVGTVQEFTSANAAPGSLSITQLGGSPVITDLGLGSEIAATQIGGADGLAPPTSNLDDDGLAEFDPAGDGIDFFESLEGMLVEVKAAVAVSPTNGVRRDLYHRRHRRRPDQWPEHQQPDGTRRRDHLGRRILVW